jgi:hypothetical protein
VTNRTDDLLRPSLQDVRNLPAGGRPWRLSSQFYVAFFGGALAVTALAWLNAVRLGATRDTRRWILVTGTVGVVVSIVVSYIFFGDDYGSAARIGYRVVGVVTSIVLYRLQRSADRVYQFRTPGSDDEQYDRMLAPGLVAVLAGGVVQLGIVFAGMSLIDRIIG